MTHIVKHIVNTLKTQSKYIVKHTQTQRKAHSTTHTKMNGQTLHYALLCKSISKTHSKTHSKQTHGKTHSKHIENTK